MKRTTFKLITLMFIISLMISVYFTVTDGSGAELKINPLYGRTPVIDGEIDTSVNEWNKAAKEHLNLYPNISNPINPLTVDLWVMQNGSNLYISIQFSLEYQYENHFLGLLMARNESELAEDFKDAKIVHFSNISANEYDYKDYFIKNSIYYEDLNLNGNGAGKIEGNDYTYEFVLPINIEENETEDVYLDYGVPGHAFQVIMGDSALYPPTYPEDIKLSNIILIELSYPPRITPTALELLYLVLSIIIFGTVGTLFIFYIYRIAKLKEKIERIRT